MSASSATVKCMRAKKDEVLIATNRVMAMEDDYKKNTAALKKEITGIASTLAELSSYASFFQKGKLKNLSEVGRIIVCALDEGILIARVLDEFCICANSIVVHSAGRSAKVVVGADLRRLKALLSGGKK